MGSSNLVTDVEGVLVGNAEDQKVQTGVTVLRTPDRAVAAVDVRGGGPGTRETDLLSPENLVREIDAVVLSGGSVYGLEAASAVTNWLGARGAGYQLRNSAIVAPIVPAAILFDLMSGGDKAWGEEPPYHRLGRAAVEAAAERFALGKAGAGLGARAGLYAGGLGSASYVADDGLAVGALFAVNAFGSPVLPGTRTLWAAPFAVADEMGPEPMKGWPKAPIGAGFPAETKLDGAEPGRNTTIGVIATNGVLGPAEAKRLAVMAQDGLSRAIRPVHTPMDGDVVFVVATGKVVLSGLPPLDLMELGSVAADCATRAIGRAVWEAGLKDG